MLPKGIAVTPGGHLSVKRMTDYQEGRRQREPQLLTPCISAILVRGRVP